MAKNPILDDLHAVRKQMLADAGGTPFLSGLGVVDEHPELEAKIIQITKSADKRKDHNSE